MGPEQPMETDPTVPPPAETMPPPADTTAPPPAETMPPATTMAPPTGTPTTVAPGNENPEVDARGIAVVSDAATRSEEHTSELPSLMRLTYAVICFNNKTKNQHTPT